MAVYIRDAHLAKPRAERDAYFARMPDRDRAERQQAAIELGTDAPQFAPAVRVLARLVDDIDRQIGDADWLAGDRFTLADVAVAPYVTRLDMLAMDPLWRDGRRPRMHAWWRRVTAAWDPSPSPSGRLRGSTDSVACGKTQNQAHDTAARGYLRSSA